MKIEVNESVLISEGIMQVICLEVDDHEQSRERDVPVSLKVLPNSATIGMCPLHLYTLCI